MDQRTMRKAIRHGPRFGAASAAARLALGCMGVAFMTRLLLYSLLRNQDRHYGNPRLLRRLRQETGRPGAANQAPRARMETKADNMSSTAIVCGAIVLPPMQDIRRVR